MSLEKYPLTLGPNMAQEQEMMFAGDAVNPAEFTTPAFSKEFKKIYGQPIFYPRAWNRLMTVTFDKTLVTQYKADFLFVAEQPNFLEFCKYSDMKASQRKQPPLGRRELEGAWIQELIFKYDQISRADLKMMIGKNWVKTEEDALRAVQWLLQNAVAKRFDTAKPATSARVIEQYWEEKGEKNPGLDVKNMPDTAESPAHELEEAVFQDEPVTDPDLDTNAGANSDDDESMDFELDNDTDVAMDDVDEVKAGVERMMI